MKITCMNSIAVTVRETTYMLKQVWIAHARQTPVRWFLPPTRLGLLFAFALISNALAKTSGFDAHTHTIPNGFEHRKQKNNLLPTVLEVTCSKILEAHENKKQQHNSQEQVKYCKHFLEELGL